VSGDGTSNEATSVEADEDALRRLGAVAAGAQITRLFSNVTDELARLLDTRPVTLHRYDPDATIVLARTGDDEFPVGSRWRLDGDSVAAVVLESGRAARIEDYTPLESAIAERVRAGRTLSTVGVPIVVDGMTWGVICAATEKPDPLPAGTETRIAPFAELIASAVAGAEGDARLRSLVDEQASLRRVATLVASGAAASEVLLAVAGEVGQVLGLPGVTIDRFEPDGSSVVLADWGEVPFPAGSRWPVDSGTVASAILETGRAARSGDYSNVSGPVAEILRDHPATSVVGVPIMVEGRVWGMIGTGLPSPQILPDDTETRLEGFTELVAAAIVNTDARNSMRLLADEQAALRRVATLVAENATTAELCAAVAEEVGRVVDVAAVTVDRYEPDGTSTVLALWGDIPFPTGSSWPVDPGTVAWEVLETGGPARIDDYSGLTGAVATAMHDYPGVSIVGVPIIVDGEVWGIMGTASRPGDPLSPGTESRLSAFTELVATAIANTDARDSLRLLADEQAALRRVATLVAEAAATSTLFSAVTEEVARVLVVPAVALSRFEADGSSTLVAAWGDRVPEPAPSPSDPSTVGVPIVVDGKVWGSMAVSSPAGAELPATVERRLGEFTELVATAISNADARDGLQGLADEQAALHRVAELVARGADASTIFDAVCEEAGALIGADSVNLARFTTDGMQVTMAAWGRLLRLPVGTRIPVVVGTIGYAIRETGRPARLEGFEGAPEELRRFLVEARIRSGVGIPVVVSGLLWGALIASTGDEQPLPHEVELRLARFTELLATAISNATARAQLIASRARLVAAGDEASRRIERELHDGAQERLVALGDDLERVRERVPRDLGAVQEGFERVAQEIESILVEVRELSRGLHPALLANGGLGPSLRVLAQRSPIPVELSMDSEERRAEPVEIAVYYTISEALTNAAKHSRATRIAVAVTAEGSTLRATIEDDGVGGAVAGASSGLTGLIDRVEALGGRFRLDSPPGGGTRIAIELPLGDAAEPSPDF
jgi:GAF domain-containing protein